VLAGFGNNGEDGREGCRLGAAVGTYLHGPLLPRNAWLADWLLARAIAHRTGKVPDLDRLTDDFEGSAQQVSAERARSRGGRF
jgi:CobQ-like glutamine amidotransferase family enzyme